MLCRREKIGSMECSSVSLKLFLRAGEMVQQLATLAGFAEDPGSVPSTHVAAHGHL